MGWLENGDYCRNSQGPDWTVEALQAEGIISPLPDEVRDYDYPNTRVVFVEGETDFYSDGGRIFHDAIMSEKTWIVLPGIGHGVVNDLNGTAAILEELLSGLAP